MENITKYPYLDKCDGCNAKMWVRLINDGNNQYCIKCDKEEY